MPVELLDRIRAGDESALASLLDAEWDGLVRFLARRLPTSDAAQDAAQEAFVRLWERRERWRAGSARGLLYRIGLNVATDTARRASVRLRRRRAAADSSTDAPPRTPAEDLALSEARARYLAALTELAPRRQEVFRLVREEGLTYQDVSEALGLSPQTVANHMGLALRELRAALADLLPPARDQRDPDQSRSNDG